MASSASRSERCGNAVEFFKTEHRLIDEGFALYFLERSEARWGDILKSTLTDLKVHMELEEELFYPLFFAINNDETHYHESMVEHEAAKKLIADIEYSDPADPQYESMIRVLWKMVARHIVQEEGLGGVLTVLESELQPGLVDRLERRREELSEWMNMPRLTQREERPERRRSR